MLLSIMLYVLIKKINLTPDPYENSIEIMRHLCHEFPFNYLLFVVMKLADFQKQMADGNLELLWAYEANGYSSTVYHKNGK